MLKFQWIPNARQVLFGSWSSRLGFLASVLGTLEVVLPAFETAFPRGPFGAAAAIVAALVPLVRVIQQRALHEDGEYVVKFTKAEGWGG